MTTHSPASSAGGNGYPSKRARRSPPDPRSPPLNLQQHDAAVPSPPQDDANDAKLPVATTGGKAGQSSSFRNVSACNRCRLRKNRCDQRLPSCASCDKANVRCVGYDPITKREIPRSYVFYLETRVAYLENLLESHHVPFAPAEVLEPASRPGPDPNAAQTPIAEESPGQHNGHDSKYPLQSVTSQSEPTIKKQREESDRLNKLVSNVGMVSVQGASDPRYLGSTSGISFARVVFAAVKSSINASGSDRGSVKGITTNLSSKATGSGGTSMRDSFFGLQTKPTISQAPFPDKALGQRLAYLYFEHANPQIPILHKEEFTKMFEAAYAEGPDRVRTPRELYMLNIVFAIGSGIIYGESNASASDRSRAKNDKGQEGKQDSPSRGSTQCQPEEYHASAIVHLESCLSSASTSDRPEAFGGGLEELQAVLLLAGFALLRPVAPGLWYIVGVAVRLAVDLGLHYEDGKDPDIGLENPHEKRAEDTSEETHRKRERGRRQYVRDFRRRLWWCVYSLDRLVSTCVGRPFGITDQVITTEFPSLLEDKYITPQGFIEPTGGATESTSKVVAHHYFRLRLLQSEILQVLQHQQARLARAGGANQKNPYMHVDLPSPFLSKFASFRDWRIDIDKRLWHWKSSAPTKRETGVAFCVEFLELNYWQAVIMLYRQSLSVPPVFESEFSTAKEVESPSASGPSMELMEDQERVFLKVAEAGQRVLRLYRQLHRVHLVNYTFLATHHLFMAGISFLYAIWHSPVVRSRLTMDEVDFTILAATSVLGDLIEKCPPAEACRDAFDRMSKATVQMCMSTTGFGAGALNRAQSHRESSDRGHAGSNERDYFANATSTQFATSNSRQAKTHPNNSRPMKTPQFDMDLNELFGGATSPNVRKRASSPPPANSANYKRSQVPMAGNATRSGAAGPQIKVEHSPYGERGSQQASLYGNGSMGSGNVNANPSPATSSNYGMSPAMDTSAIDPSLLPSSHQGQQQMQSVQSPHYGGGGDGTAQAESGAPMYGFGQGLDEFQLQGLDLGFLQGSGLGGVQGANGEAMQAQTGMDLGFGLGWEAADHDFSEGNGVDLFDGFFFGGTGGNFGGG